jgi:hypothetical protein
MWIETGDRGDTATSPSGRARCRALGSMLRGAADRLDGRPEAAADQLCRALVWFDDTGLHAAATRRRLGQLVGGREGHDLVAAAAADFAAREVVDPEATTRLFNPRVRPGHSSSPLTPNGAGPKAWRSEGPILVSLWPLERGSC